MQLIGKVNTWKFQHDFVLTAEVSEERENSGALSGVNELTSLYYPNANDAYPFPVVRLPETRTHLDDYAFSLFDSIKLPPQIILSGGARYDHLEARSANPKFVNPINGSVTQAFASYKINDLAKLARRVDVQANRLLSAISRRSVSASSSTSTTSPTRITSRCSAMAELSPARVGR